MRNSKFFKFLFFMMALALVATGCSPDEDAKALKDEEGIIVSLENKENPSLIFFFTGIG